MRILSIIKRIIQSLLLICILFLPLFLVLRFQDSLFFKKLEETLLIESGDLLSCSIDYVSLIIALLLGLVAYYQTKAINDLEMLKYGVFVGIEKIDYSTEYRHPSELQNPSTDFYILQNVSGEGKNLTAHLNMVKPNHPTGTGKLLHIPLVFITRNEPLIVSVNVTAIHLRFYHPDTSVTKKTFRRRGNKFDTILNSGDHFKVNLGIVIHESEIISTIEVAYDFIIEDHHGRKHTMRTHATLKNQTNGVYLTASRTQQLTL